MTADRTDRLAEFVTWARAHIRGDEKGEAHIFLDRLFQALGHKGALDVGGTPEFRVRKSKDDGGGTAFADYVWKPYVLIEMKKRGTDLSRHYRQAFDYWTRLVPGRPRYAILCNFDEFWVYDFETQMDTPVDQLPLNELPQRWGPLAFLFPSHERPVFGNDQEQVTRDAADKLATCFNKLIVRHVPRETAQRFTLQMLVALFAEDIGLLEKYFVTRLLEEIKSPADSFDLLGGLFEAMNSREPARGGRYKGVDYFNGGLFEQPARVELYDDELAQLREAAKKNWSKVRPEIFGTLFEHSLEKAERHAYGGHFTHPTDIMKIVGPTIVEPWRNLIENASKIEDLEKLHTRMQHYRVLDPACGSGNFLYIAYRELKRLETRIFERIAERRKTETGKAQRQFSFVTARQFFGMDINPFAIEIAKVTMMIARKLAIDELHVHEQPLPLDNLDQNFIAGDALITPLKSGGEPIPTMLFAELEEDPWKSGRAVPTKWPAADVIIGNPPFLGAKRLKPERGTDYVNAVRKTFPDVPGMADYCVYWFRLAHDHLPPCTVNDPLSGRAGLVGTQNVRNNQSRVGGLDHIVQSGTIVEAVDNQPWSGEANVHVSIVNWVKTKDPRLLPKKRKLWFKVDPPPERRKVRKRTGTVAAKEYELDVQECPSLGAALTVHTDVTSARWLRSNEEPQRSFNGQMLGHDAFLLTGSERAEILRRDPNSSEVICPYLNGREALDLSGDGHPERFVLDFGQRDQLEAAAYPGAFNWVKERVLPDRERKAKEGVDARGRQRSHHKGFLMRWWQLSFGRPELISLISRVSRYLCCSLVTKRPIFVFVSSQVRPSNLLQVFALDDDYTFGVLQSHVHWRWFIEKCSKLKSDFRYGEGVWNTFPWPQSPTPKQVRAVAEAGREVRRVRADALTQIEGGLRAVYRTLELPGQNPLKDAHAALDAAVLDAYGFSSPRASEASIRTPHASEGPATGLQGGDLLQQILDLNLAVATRIDNGEPVTAPGIPTTYPTPADLITDDCIRPAGD